MIAVAKKQVRQLKPGEKRISIVLSRPQFESLCCLKAAGSSSGEFVKKCVLYAIEGGNVEIGEPQTIEEELAQDVTIRERAKRIKKANDKAGIIRR